MSNIRIGIASADITPPVGMLMSGYGNRKTGAVDIHDELETVALYLTDGETEAGLITADLIDTDMAGTARVRKAASAATDIPADHIMVAFSHTHGGPQTTLRAKPDPNPLMEAYTQVVIAKLAGALARAKRAAQPVQLAYARQDCDIATNRRERTANGVILGVNPDGPKQPFTDVLRIDTLDGAPLAVLLSYACHGTTLGGDNLLYTADYIGYAKRAVKAALPAATPAFLATCSGDINPYPRGSYDWAITHGTRLGCAAAQAALEGQPMAATKLAVASAPIRLHVEPPPSLAQARADLAHTQAEAEALIAQARQQGTLDEANPEEALDWFTARRLRNGRALVEALEQGETDFGIDMVAQAIAIGDWALIGLPGEVFVRIGMDIAKRSPFAHTIVSSHTNGSAGYIPTADEIAAGGYEIAMARANVHGLPILPESEDALIQQGLAALQQCYEQLT